MNVFNKIGWIVLILIGCNGKDIKEKASYSFYDTSNFYSKSPLIKNFDFYQFALWDEVDFFNLENYNYYIVYCVYNEYFKGKYDVYSIKSFNKVDMNILSHSVVVYNNGKPMIEPEWSAKNIFNKYNYVNAKNSFKISVGAASSLKKTMDSFVLGIHPYQKNASFFETYRTLFYFDGKKYYLINQDFIDYSKIEEIGSIIKEIDHR